MSANEIKPGKGYTISIAGETGYRDGLKVVPFKPFAFERAKSAAEKRKAALAKGKNVLSKETKSTT